jgi:hypothetical protein
MLTGMKADIFASRALSLDLAVSIDMATATGDPRLGSHAPRS